VKYQKPDEPLVYEEVWQCLNAGYGGLNYKEELSH